MKKVWLILLLLLTAIPALAGCGGQGAEEPAGAAKPPMTVRVMLQEHAGIKILGENPVSVPVGEDAAFAVEICDGYTIETATNGATYENGTLTVPSVQFPTTVKVSTRVLKDLTIQVNNDSAKGAFAANVEMGTVREHTKVTLQVTPAENLVFLGYSVGGLQADGGTIVCASSEYTFEMNENVELFTNYYKAGSGRLVVYDGNGAKEGIQYYVFSNKSAYIGPNALANKGQFTREGYVLYGYNTAPDGSGTFYGPGWSVILPEDPEVPTTLYAQWLPVTPKEAFTYTVSGKNVTITGYSGEDELVVIPETIGGKAVTKIASGAFVDGKFKTLYLSRNLKTIENKAFQGCKSLTTLYLCDTPSSMKDAAFTDCPELQKLYMLACIDPRYSNTNDGMYKIKYQRLLSAQGKKIIFQGGSNVAYGIDISTIHTMLEDAYAGVNFGCRQSSPSAFYVEVAAAHMNPGDILVLCPEYHAFQFGHNEMNTIAWQVFEGAYNAYADVDIRHYTKVFTSFAAFNANRYRSSVHGYERYESAGGKPAVSKFGEFNINHNGMKSDLYNDLARWRSGRDMVKLDLGLLAQDYNANMARSMDAVVAKGGKVYISFPSIVKDSIVKAHRTESHQQAFKQAVAEAFPQAVVISDPGTYVMEKKKFYNSGYHLTTAASKERTKLLAEDILAQLAKE